MLSIGGGKVKINYQYLFGLPRNTVWKYLKDEKVLRSTLPGCTSFIEISKGVYHAELKITIGPIQDLIKLEIFLNEEKAPSNFQLHVRGNGNLVKIMGHANLSLKENQGGTLLTCKGEAQITGALALAGQSLLDSGTYKGLDNFFQKLEMEIKRRIYEMKKKRREHR